MLIEVSWEKQYHIRVSSQATPKPCHSTGYWLIGADYMGMMTQSQKHFDEVLK